jgi:porin
MRVKAFFIFLLFSPHTVLWATEGLAQSFWQRDTLTGHWGETRAQITNRGISLEAIYTGEVFSNLSGGLRRQTVYLDNVDLTLTLDAEKLVGWQGARFSVYGLGNQGGSPSDQVGDAQVISSIEAFDTWKLYEAWFQQNLFDHRLSILLGLYEVSSEFDFIQVAQLFTHSSFGTGPDFSQSGKNGPSIFPTTSLGARVGAKLTNAFYLQTAVLDGVPGDPEDPHGTQIIFGDNEGLLVATEIGYLMGIDKKSSAPTSPMRERAGRRRIGRGEQVAYDGKIAFGGWFYTAKFDNLVDVDGAGKPIQHTGNHGIYGLAEQTVQREEGSPTQGLALFVRLGIADTSFNQFGLYTGGGVVYTGLIPKRDEDQLGFAIAAAHNGSRFKRARRNAGRPVDNAEIALELTYRAHLTPWLAVQPDIQYVINPGTEPAVKNAFLVGIRFEVSF